MRYLFFVFLLILTYVSPAFSGTAYEAILLKNGKRIGFFVLYKDINPDIIKNVNKLLSKLIIENGEFQVEKCQEMSESDLWLQVSNIMEYGAEEQGLDAALGILVYFKEENDNKYIYIEQYLLGIEQNNKIIPYILLKLEAINIFD